MALSVNFERLTVFRGRESQLVVALDENENVVEDAAYAVSGCRSAASRVKGRRVFAAPDETADELVLCVRKDGEEACIPVTVKDAPQTEAAFDENNVVLTFAVTSDTHVSGSWNQERSSAKWAHAIGALQSAAGRNADGTTKLDALLCAGDFIDSVNSFGNVSKNPEAYGRKGAQNYREVAYIRSGLEGRDTNHAEEIDDGCPRVHDGFGKGLEKDVRFFYCLGNHDERGRGVSASNEQYAAVQSARYFVAVLCGWQYHGKNAAPGSADGYDGSYVGYAQDLLALHRAPAGKKDALLRAFTQTHGVDGAYALGRFEAYYESDTDYTEQEHGLFFGNRHTVIHGMHFIAIESSKCEESAAFLDRWCAASVAEDPKKPIFVLTHHKIYHTVNDWDHQGTTARLLKVLAKYPQCFVWTGHTHSVLHNENAIVSDCGFTSVEGSVLAYYSCGFLAANTTAGNYCRKEDHDAGVCCLVKVDREHNVKIERIDVHRSYKEAFGTKDRAVAVKTPWIVSGIAPDGAHLLIYDRERGKRKAPPVFSHGAKVSVEQDGDGRVTVCFPAAHDPDMVKYYLVRLENETDKDDAPYQYVTSFYFRYPNEDALQAALPVYTVTFPAQKENRVSAELDACVARSTPRKGAFYRVSVTAFDGWDNASPTITDEPL